MTRGKTTAAAALVVLVLAAAAWVTWWKATADDRRRDAQREVQYEICAQQAKRAPDVAQAIIDCVDRYGG